MHIFTLLPTGVLRLLRKLMLKYGRLMDAGRMQARSKRGALQVAAQAAKHSFAYQTLLREHQIDPLTLGYSTEFEMLPILNKSNTFEQFTLCQLARPLDPKALADVLTSSGRSGRIFATGSRGANNMRRRGLTLTSVCKRCSTSTNTPLCWSTACQWAWCSAREP